MHTRRHATLRMNILWEVSDSKKKAILHVARTVLSISSESVAKSRRGELSHGLCDSAPGTDDYPAEALDAVFGYGAVVPAPCAVLICHYGVRHNIDISELMSLALG
jgi:hypothetical protein